MSEQCCICHIALEDAEAHTWHNVFCSARYSGDPGRCSCGGGLSCCEDHCPICAYAAADEIRATSVAALSREDPKP